MQINNYKKQPSEYKMVSSFLGGGGLSLIITVFISSFIRAQGIDLEYIKKFPVDLTMVSPEPQEIIGYICFWIIYSILLFFLLKSNFIINEKILYLLGAFFSLFGIYVLLLFIFKIYRFIKFYYKKRHKYEIYIL